MAHDSYWKDVKTKAECRLADLFEGSHTRIRDLVGDDNGIDEVKDVKKVLAYVLRHGDCEERACAIISAGEWVHAAHELSEHGPAAVAGSVN